MEEVPEFDAAYGNLVNGFLPRPLAREQDREEAKDTLRAVEELVNAHKTMYCILLVGFAGHGKSSLIRLWMFLLETFRSAVPDQKVSSWGKMALPALRRLDVEGHGTLKPRYYIREQKSKQDKKYPCFGDLVGIVAMNASTRAVLRMCIEGLVWNEEKDFCYNEDKYWPKARSLVRWSTAPGADTVVLCHRSCEMFEADGGNTFRSSWSAFLTEMKSLHEHVKVVVVLTFRQGLTPEESSRAMGSRDTQAMLNDFAQQLSRQFPHLTDQLQTIDTNPLIQGPQDAPNIDEETKLENAVSREYNLCGVFFQRLSAILRDVPNAPAFGWVQQCYRWPTKLREKRVRELAVAVSKNFPVFLLDSPRYDILDTASRPKPDPWDAPQWENTKNAANALYRIFLKGE